MDHNLSDPIVLKAQFDSLFADYKKKCQTYSHETRLWQDEVQELTNALSNKEKEVNELHVKFNDFSKGNLADDSFVRELQFKGLEKQNAELKRENSFMKSVVESYYEAVEELQRSKIKLYDLFLSLRKKDKTDASINLLQTKFLPEEAKKISINDSLEYCEYETPTFELESDENQHEASFESDINENQYHEIMASEMEEVLQLESQNLEAETPITDMNEIGSLQNYISKLEAELSSLKENHAKKIKELTAYNMGLTHENNLLRKNEPSDSDNFKSDEIKRLRALIEGKEVVNIALKSQVQLLLKKINKGELTEKEIYELNEKIFSLKCGKNLTEGEVGSLRGQLESKNKEIKNLRLHSEDDLNKLRNQLGDMTKDNNNNQEYIKYLENHLNELNNLIDEHQIIKDKLYLNAEEHLNLKNEYANVLNQLDDYKEGHKMSKVHEAKLKDLQQTVEFQEQNIKNLSNELDDKNKELESKMNNYLLLQRQLEDTGNNYNLQLASLNTENATLKDTINTLNNDLKINGELQEQDLESLRKQLIESQNELEEKIKDFEEINETLQQEIDDLKAELNNQHEEKAQILNNISAVEIEKVTLREEYDVHLGSLNTNINDMNENMNKLNEKWGKYSEDKEIEISELLKKLLEEENKNKILTNDFNELAIELKNLKKTQAYLEKVLKENENEINMKNEEIEKLWYYKTEMGDVSKVFNAKDDQFKALRGNFEKLNENFNSLMKYKNILENELKKKNEEIEALHFDSNEFNKQLDSLIKSHKLMQAELNATKQELSKNSEIMEIYHKSGLFDVENEKLKHSKEALKQELEKVWQEIENVKNKKANDQKTECIFVNEPEVNSENLGSNWVMPAYEASWMNDESSRLAKYLEKISQLEEENKALINRLNEAEKHSTDSSETMQQDIELLRKNLVNKEEEINYLKIYFEKMKDFNDNKMNEYNVLKDDYDQYKGANESKINDYQMEINNYIEKCSKLEEQIKLLEKHKQEVPKKLTIQDKILMQSEAFLKGNMKNKPKTSRDKLNDDKKKLVKPMPTVPLHQPLSLISPKSRSTNL